MEVPQKPDYLDVAYDGDVCVLELRGDYDLPAEIYMAYLREYAGERFGYRLTIIDVSRAGTVTHDARVALAKWNKARRPPGSLAFVGASFTVRTISNMLMSATRILTGRRTEFSFFKTHADALAWIATERARLQALAQAQGWMPQSDPEGMK